MLYQLAKWESKQSVISQFRGKRIKQYIDMTGIYTCLPLNWCITGKGNKLACYVTFYKAMYSSYCILTRG